MHKLIRKVFIGFISMGSMETLTRQQVSGTYFCVQVIITYMINKTLKKLINKQTLLSNKMLTTALLIAVNVIHSNLENIYLFLGLQLILKSS